MVRECTYVEGGHDDAFCETDHMVCKPSNEKMVEPNVLYQLIICHVSLYNRYS